MRRALRSRSSRLRQSKLDISNNTTAEDSHTHNCLLRTIKFTSSLKTSYTSLWEALQIVKAIKVQKDDLILNNLAFNFGKSVREMEIFRSSTKEIEKSVKFYKGNCCDPSPSNSNIEVEQAAKTTELEVEMSFEAFESSQEDLTPERTRKVPIPYKGRLCKSRMKRLKRPCIAKKEEIPSSSMLIFSAGLPPDALDTGVPSSSGTISPVAIPSSMTPSPSSFSDNEAETPFFSSTPKRPRLRIVTESADLSSDANETSTTADDIQQHSSAPAAFFAFTPKISPICLTRPRVKVRPCSTVPAQPLEFEDSAKEEERSDVTTFGPVEVDWVDLALDAFPTNNESKNSSGGIPSLAERDLLAYLEQNTESFNTTII